MRRQIAATSVVLGVIGAALLSAGAQDSPARTGAASGDRRRRGPRVLFNRFNVPASTVRVANADGSNERTLVPQLGLTYSPVFSADGRWIVFTAEKDGQADVFRVRADGRRTSGPSTSPPAPRGI
jgi:hypothetical protein